MFGLHPLDPLGFGRIGFEYASRSFKPLVLSREATPSLVVAVTGATSGLGLALTKELAKTNCTIYMLCRNVEKAEEVKRQITPNDRVHIAKVDVASLQSVRDLPSLPAIDVLVQNAGHLPSEYYETADGFESTVATHIVNELFLQHAF